MLKDQALRDKALKSLLKAFSNTPDLNSVVFELETILQTKNPFAMYTPTLTIGEWIFNKETIVSMVGGEDRYNEIAKETCPNGEVLFVLLKKVGPIISVPVDIDMINWILDKLHELM